MAMPNFDPAAIQAQIDADPQVQAILRSSRNRKELIQRLNDLRSRGQLAYLPPGYGIEPIRTGSETSGRLHQNESLGDAALQGGLIAGGFLGGGAALGALGGGGGAVAPAVAPAVTGGGGMGTLGSIMKGLAPTAIGAATNIWGQSQANRGNDRAAQLEAEAAANQLAFLKEQEAARQREFQQTQDRNYQLWRERDDRLAPYRRMGAGSLGQLSQPIPGSIGSLLG